MGGSLEGGGVTKTSSGVETVETFQTQVPALSRIRNILERLEKRWVAVQRYIIWQFLLSLTSTIKSLHLATIAVQEHKKKKEIQT